MRKIVTFIAFLSFLMTFYSCNSNEGNSSNAEPITAQKNTKAKKPKQASANIDEVLLEDSLQSADTAGTKAQVDMILEDSLSNKLPLPESEEVFDAMNEYTDLDSLGADNEDYAEGEDYTEAEWLDEGDTEEYVDYSNGDLNLQKERILKTEIILVQVPEVQDERDSVLAVIEERMSIHADQISKQIVVEKWYSPVNYRGYKFNRKKLMLYGVEKPALISIYFYLGNYYFALNNQVYDLDESTKNTAFQTVGDTVLSNYLLKHDNKL